MRIKTTLLTLASVLVVVAAPAQTYSVDWHSVSAGGGTSRAGIYSVTGHIGQTEAGTNEMSGGTYSVEAGFWSLLSAVDMASSPTLKIFLTSTNTAVVYWPFPSTGYSLQQSATLSAADWTSVSETVTIDGTNKFVVVMPPAGTRFYRLSK